jgi:hypothetical protein
MGRSNRYRQYLFVCLMCCGVLWLLVLALIAPSLAFGSEIEEYAGLSEGLQKTYQVIEKENDVEVDRRVLRIRVLPKRRVDNKNVIPVEVTNEGLNSKNKIKWSIVEYMLLSSDRLEMVATKYPQEIELHKRNDVILKAPLDIGATWITGEYEKVIEGKNDKIKVPAGAFTNCLKMKTTRKIDGKMVYEETAWYAPGVGQIKKIATYTLENRQFITQMIAVHNQK